MNICNLIRFPFRLIRWKFQSPLTPKDPLTSKLFLTLKFPPPLLNHLIDQPFSNPNEATTVSQPLKKDDTLLRVNHFGVKSEGCFDEGIEIDFWVTDTDFCLQHGVNQSYLLNPKIGFWVLRFFLFWEWEDHKQPHPKLQHDIMNLDKPFRTYPRSLQCTPHHRNLEGHRLSWTIGTTGTLLKRIIYSSIDHHV